MRNRSHCHAGAISTGVAMLGLVGMFFLVMFIQIAFVLMVAVGVLWAVCAGIERLRGSRPVEPTPLDAAAQAHRARMAQILGADHDLIRR